MNRTISNEEQIAVRLAPVTAGGQPASLDGPATFEVTSGDATVVPDADGLGFLAVSGAAGVQSVITVTADADLGSGVQTLTDTFVLDVVAASASGLGMTAGQPTLK